MTMLTLEAATEILAAFKADIQYIIRKLIKQEI